MQTIENGLKNLIGNIHTYKIEIAFLIKHIITTINTVKNLGLCPDSKLLFLGTVAKVTSHIDVQYTPIPNISHPIDTTEWMPYLLWHFHLEKVLQAGDSNSEEGNHPCCNLAVLVIIHINLLTCARTRICKWGIVARRRAGGWN